MSEHALPDIVKSDSGVYEAIGKLPDVPVLQKLTESIDTATRSLNELRDEKLASMAVVGEIDADGRAPPAAPSRRR